MWPATIIIIVQIVLAIVLAWGFFRRYRTPRPPIGVFNLWDVALMVACIIWVPQLHMIAPRWLVASLLGLGFLGILLFTLEAIGLEKGVAWLLTLLLMAGNVIACTWAGPRLFYSINNVLLLIVTVGVTNMWAQSGMRARDAAILGAALGVYDFLATWQTGVMLDIIKHMGRLPFVPIFIWPTTTGSGWVGTGLGDVLFAALFPLVARKAFGKQAGQTALALAIVTLAGLVAAYTAGWYRVAFPAMIVLGPLMLVQFVYWTHRLGRERTTWEYQCAGVPASARSDRNGTRPVT